jgi:hypothetical protein
MEENRQPRQKAELAKDKNDISAVVVSGHWSKDINSGNHAQQWKQSLDQ